LSLDLNRVAGQVGEMIARLRASVRDRDERLRFALETLHSQSGSLPALAEKIAAARTTWLVAGLVDGLDACILPPPLPADFTVLAADGSHIEVDRHRAARCYLLNTGRVTLRYGGAPGAALESVPQLYAAAEDLVVTSPDGRGREVPVEGNLLGAKRSVEECRHLANLAAGLPQGTTALALLDGSLVLWGLEQYPEFVGDTLLAKGLLPQLDRLRQSGAALASYISQPRATDVVNVLRVAVCGREKTDCDHCPVPERDCAALAGLQDRDLFFNLLAPGERSALFVSQSSVVREQYGEHRVNFAYVRLPDEIARIEMPQWVADKPEMVGLTHALALDQCRRGDGYPVALSEAHEQAVVTVADRENFWRLVEAGLVSGHLPTPGSGKSRSKRTRWV
jgi:hypothetical protein